MGGAWLSTHLWEHYLFTQDKMYLKKRSIHNNERNCPILLEWLVEDKEGKLINFSIYFT